MLKNLEINKVLFLDIETVPMVEQWEDLSENWKNLWQKKISYQLKEEETAEEMFYQRAGIMAEFGKIVCISFGMIVKGEKLRDRKSTRLNSSHVKISYAVFCL